MAEVARPDQAQEGEHVVVLDIEAGLTSLEGIDRFTGLQQLLIGGTEVDSLAPLRTCSELSFLNIENTAVDDLTPLADLPKLRRLMARDCPYTSVPALTDLEMFFVSDAVEDPSQLAKLTSLRVLKPPSHVSDLGFLRPLGALFNLDVSRSAVEDIAPLADLPHLGMLDLRGTAVRNLSPLRGLTELMDLTTPDGTRIRGVQQVAEYLASV